MSSRQIEVAVITGLSGSGKSTVAKCFEDLGYYCIDNLPLSLLGPLLEDPSSHVPNADRVAVVTDIRAAGVSHELPALLQPAEGKGPKRTPLFLDASDETLVRRFSETRRSHPLSRGSSEPLIDIIHRERAALADLRGIADVLFDTSEWSVHEIRRQVFQVFETDPEQRPAFAVSLTSFGFKHGVPYAADMIFDVRFLPNPHFVPDLRDFTGRSPAVQHFLTSHEVYNDFLDRLTGFVEYLLPLYRREQRSYLSIGIGCTGGKHRSVATAEELAKRLRAQGWAIQLHHRDAERG